MGSEIQPPELDDSYADVSQDEQLRPLGVRRVFDDFNFMCNSEPEDLSLERLLGAGNTLGDMETFLAEVNWTELR